MKTRIRCLLAALLATHVAPMRGPALSPSVALAPRRRKRNGVKPYVLGYAAAGALSTCVSHTLTLPLDVLKTRIQSDAALAGFVEPGEDLEQAVAREVREDREGRGGRGRHGARTVETPVGRRRRLLAMHPLLQTRRHYQRRSAAAGSATGRKRRSAAKALPTRGTPNNSAYPSVGPSRPCTNFRQTTRYVATVAGPSGLASTAPPSQ